MSTLRKQLIQQMQLKGYSPKTIKIYISSIAQISSFYSTPADLLTIDQIRYYGLFATRNRSTTLARCRKAMCKTRLRSGFAGLTWQEQLRLITGKDITVCPACKKGKMLVTTTFKGIGSLA
jgi:hypothetical protein